MVRIDIHRATLRNIDDLVSIHRECFPEEVLYQVPKSYAKRWWSFLLAFDSVEIYVASVSGEAAGFAILKIDAEEYQRQKKKHKAPFLIRAYTVLVTPKIFIEIIRKFFYRLTPISNNIIAHKYNKKYTSNCIWIDLVAISSKYHRKGVATQLMTFLDKRAAALNRTTIVLIVAINNEPSFKMCENLGYERIGYIQNYYILYNKAVNLHCRDYKINSIESNNHEELHKKMNNKHIDDCYAIKVVKSIEEIENIRDIWQQMQWHPNADIDYYLTVVDSRDEIIRPHIITLYKNDRPVTMLIGRIEDLRLELRIGYKILFRPTVRSLTVVYGGILGETANPNIKILIDELIKSLTRGVAEVVFLSHLNVNSDIYRLAMIKPSYLRRNYFPVPKLHWKMSVPATMEEFYATMKYKFRKNLRRSARKLVKTYPDNVTIQCFRKKSEIEQFIRDSEEIVKKTYQRGFGVGFIDNIENRRLITLSSEQGWLRSYILYVDGNPVAFERMLQYSNTLFCQNAAFDPDYHDIEPGTNIFLKILEELSAVHSIDDIDFGFGHAQYKQNFSDQSWKEESVFIFAPTIKCIAINLVRTLFSAFSEFAEKILRQTNLYKKIKKYWRIRLTHKSNNDNGNS